jgi:preprotein translocase subunit YajC
MPFFILIIIWMFGYFFMRTRERRQLQREIDDLNDIEQESRR